MFSTMALCLSVPAVAYPEAWSFTFFMSEQEPAKYLKYLARTANRQPLKKYSSGEQHEEFTDIFGRDWTMLEARYLRFIARLP